MSVRLMKETMKMKRQQIISADVYMRDGKVLGVVTHPRTRKHWMLEMPEIGETITVYKKEYEEFSNYPDVKRFFVRYNLSSPAYRYKGQPTTELWLDTEKGVWVIRDKDGRKQIPEGWREDLDLRRIY